MIFIFNNYFLNYYFYNSFTTSQMLSRSTKQLNINKAMMSYHQSSWKHCISYF